MGRQLGSSERDSGVLQDGHEKIGVIASLLMNINSVRRGTRRLGRGGIGEDRVVKKLIKKGRTRGEKRKYGRFSISICETRALEKDEIQAD